MKLLEVVAGLLLVYLIFAIVVSGIQEWWAQYRGHRGKFLRIGLQRLIGDESIFVRVLQHPLIGSLYRDRAARGKPPSYIEPNNFALAFAHVVTRRQAALDSGDAKADSGGSVPLSFDSLRSAITKLAAQRSPVAAAALPIVDQAQGNLDLALKGIGAWYSGGMDRLTGWYKGYAQRRLFLIGFMLACLANVDTIEIYKALNSSADLRSQVVSIAETVAHSQKIGDVDLSVLNTRDLTPSESQTVLKTILSSPVMKLPIGYGCLDSDAVQSTKIDSKTKSTWSRCTRAIHNAWNEWTFSDWLRRIFGWALTAFAGLLGAPYWFAALTNIVDIRGSGTKPKEPKPA